MTTNSVRIGRAGTGVSQSIIKQVVIKTNSVLQREVLLRQLLKTNDNVIAGNICPRASRDKRSTSALVLLVLEDAQRRLLDIDCVAGIDELLSNRRRDSGTVLEGLGLSTDVEDC